MVAGCGGDDEGTANRREPAAATVTLALTQGERGQNAEGGSLRYSPSHTPDPRPALFVGPANGPKLLRRQARFTVREIRPGVSRFSVQTPTPTGTFRLQVCFDYPDGGAYGAPGRNCVGSTRPNDQFRP